MKKEYYKLKEAAEISDCPIEDILYLAEQREIQLHIRPQNWRGKYEADGEEQTRIISDLQPMAQWMVEQIRAGYMLESNLVSMYVTSKGVITEEVSIPNPEQVSKNALFIIHKELQRLRQIRAKNPVDSSYPLINLPEQRKNEWVEIIISAVDAFHKKNKRYPSGDETWMFLRSNSLDGFEIVAGEDRGEAAILYSGKPLPKGAFNKRWKRYTR